MEKIGIFGGTFDPPHLGHLILAAEACAQLSLDRILWVLTPDPPHKRQQNLTPVSVRLEMVKEALQNAPKFELSRVDLDRVGPHYTIDTIRLIQNDFPDSEIFYLIGGDSLHDFPNWHHAKEILTSVKGLGAMRRPGDQIDLSLLEEALPGIIEKINFVEAPLLEIASNEIRRRIKQGLPYRYYLYPPVYEKIKEQGLYLK